VRAISIRPTSFPAGVSRHGKHHRVTLAAPEGRPPCGRSRTGRPLARVAAGPALENILRSLPIGRELLAERRPGAAVVCRPGRRRTCRHRRAPPPGQSDEGLRVPWASHHRIPHWHCYPLALRRGDVCRATPRAKSPRQWYLLLKRGGPRFSVINYIHNNAIQRVGEGGTALDPEVVAVASWARPPRGTRPVRELPPGGATGSHADGRGPLQRGDRPAGLYH